MAAPDAPSIDFFHVVLPASCGGGSRWGRWCGSTPLCTHAPTQVPAAGATRWPSYTMSEESPVS
uniref:Uncharacterized protein n=1 Tax=Triticum urartu TaxID=4572 RepID=A0A8R7R573_TRIUA